MSEEQKKQSTNVDKYVGQRLKARRLLLKISQESLAQSAGITFQQVQKYESAANRVSASRLYQFSQALDVSISYFFPDDTVSKKKPNAHLEKSTYFKEEVIESKETLILLRLYYSVKNPDSRKDILLFLKRMSNLYQDD